MSDASPSALHPAENRGLRELYAAARQLRDHWARLADALASHSEGSILRDGAGAGATLIRELEPVTARYDLYGFPAAVRLGGTVADARASVADRFLERNQALRLAVLDAHHVATLLAYLGRLAARRNDGDLVDFHARWQRRIERLERAARRAAVAAGDDPDAAIEPLDRSPLGRAGHGAAYAIGSIGEWVDRRRGRR